MIRVFGCLAIYGKDSFGESEYIKRKVFANTSMSLWNRWCEGQCGVRLTTFDSYYWLKWDVSILCWHTALYRYWLQIFWKKFKKYLQHNKKSSIFAPAFVTKTAGHCRGFFKYFWKKFIKNLVVSKIWFIFALAFASKKWGLKVE